jgi:hypothetical protein
MTRIIDKPSQRTAAQGGKEGMIMKHTILTMIATMGLLIPVLWMTGTATSIIYFCLRRGVGGRERRDES